MSPFFYFSCSLGILLLALTGWLYLLTTHHPRFTFSSTEWHSANGSFFVFLYWVNSYSVECFLETIRLGPPNNRMSFILYHSQALASYKSPQRLWQNEGGAPFSSNPLCAMIATRPNIIFRATRSSSAHRTHSLDSPTTTTGKRLFLTRPARNETYEIIVGTSCGGTQLEKAQQGKLSPELKPSTGAILKHWKGGDTGDPLRSSTPTSRRGGRLSSHALPAVVCYWEAKGPSSFS